LKRKILLAVLAFFLGAASLMVLITAVFIFHFMNPYCCSRFDANAWEMAGQGPDWEVTKKEMACIRGEMLNDLRSNHLKAGMRKEELFSLLGAATQSLDDEAKGCFSYSVGYCRGLGFDLNAITFCFDASGRLLDRNGKTGK
jgi:hypothetical protein